jgi:hypothetical protein
MRFGNRGFFQDNQRRSSSLKPRGACGHNVLIILRNERNDTLIRSLIAFKMPDYTILLKYRPFILRAAR